MIYSAPGFWDALPTTTQFGGDVLWVANWEVSCPDTPTPWTAWQFWQYADNGTVPGITGAVDLDKFNGSLAQLGEPGGEDGGVDAGRPGDAGEVADAGRHADAGGEADAGHAGDAGAAKDAEAPPTEGEDAGGPKSHAEGAVGQTGGCSVSPGGGEGAPAWTVVTIGILVALRRGARVIRRRRAGERPARAET